MSLSPDSLKSALRSPLLPFWLVVALLPFGRSSEFGTFLCAVGTAVMLVRAPQALRGQAGARLLLWLLAAYIGAGLVSSFGSLAPGKSWGTVAALLRYLPLGLFACGVIRDERRLYTLYVAVACVLAWWTLDAWMQALTGWSLGGHAEAERISGIFGARNLKLGPTLAVLSPFALWAARRRWGFAGLAIAFLVMLGPILLAGSRAAWLCYGLVALAFAWREARSWRRFMLYCALGVVALAAVGGVAWRTSARFDARMERTLDALHGTRLGLDQALTGRLEIWRDSLRMIAAHPVNGVGVRAFRYAYPEFAPADDHFVVAESCGEGEGACHAHQIVLEILTETGGIGLALWLAGVVLALRVWRRVGAAARERAFPVTLALAVMLFPLNTHLAFYSAWWGLLFAWLLGLWCSALFAGIPAGKAKTGIPAGLLKEALPSEHHDAA
ncbi:O-antigen ligase family protein [Rhodanobacter sp. 7MK24]|uniref:O-antigen ligase family protein n=1 Tax=Rhodanobacter sp. 7MK24 TaxID=2775922 RepID=UPI001780D4CA|nr:O-antigen ligase family protein [Rhodanobacter sp. 7MK24]MBD8881192.1 O-antigen ligase family protein [Rhodanobacter sp. 7MK24]